MNGTASAPVAAAGGEDEAPRDEDQRLVLHNVSWARYLALRELLDEIPNLRMTYLEGTLEIMSPSHRHERKKKLLARLVETYATERRIRLAGEGSTTFRKEAMERGLEPDECYTIDRDIDDDDEDFVPDVAIDVVLSRPKVDKLAVYGGLGVPEVWLYRRGRIEIHGLDEGAYRRRERSAFLPDLDLALVEEILAARMHPADAVDLFLQRLRG